MANPLSAEQRRKLDSAIRPLLDAAANTAAIDRQRCIESIGAAYARLGLAMPELLFVDSPLAAMDILLQRVGEGDPGPPPEAGALAGIGLPADILGMLLSAQSRNVQALGEELDLSFHDELNEAMEAGRGNAAWSACSKYVDKLLGMLGHYKRAVEIALEAHLPNADQRWLIYSGGAESIWGAAHALARARALQALELIPELPAEYPLATAVVQSCGWVNAFERLCIVSDRPQVLGQAGSLKGPEGLCSSLTWRDGRRCAFVFR